MSDYFLFSFLSIFAYFDFPHISYFVTMQTPERLTMSTNEASSVVCKLQSPLPMVSDEIDPQGLSDEENTVSSREVGSERFDFEGQQGNLISH